MKYLMYFIEGGVKSVGDLVQPCAKFRDKMGYYPNLVLVDDEVGKRLPQFASLEIGEDKVWISIEGKPFVLTNHILVGFSNETIMAD